MGKLHHFLPIHTPSPPRGSLLVITSTLGAPSTWLCHSWICETLKQKPIPIPIPIPPTSAGNTAVVGISGVVLVSFLNDERFHKEGLRRGGVDCEKVVEKKRFAYVDGLGGLFTPPTPAPSPQSASAQIQKQQVVAGGGGGIGSVGTRSSLLSPVRGPGSVGGRQTEPIRNPGASSAPSEMQSGTIDTTVNASPTLHLPTSNTPGTEGSRLRGLYSTISQAIAQVTNSDGNGGSGSGSGSGVKPLLVLENPDILLSAGELSAWEVWDWVMDLREISRSLLLFLSADSPLLQPAVHLSSTIFHHQPPPHHASHSHPRLETEHSAFLMMAVHNASMVVGLRLLDTGFAKDVSGVMRITAGGDGLAAGSGGDESVDGGNGNGDEGSGGGWRVEEKEVLYYVGDSSVVEVFERGEVRGG